jgi:hypothetical protein
MELSSAARPTLGVRIGGVGFPTLRGAGVRLPRRLSTKVQEFPSALQREHIGGPLHFRCLTRQVVQVVEIFGLIGSSGVCRPDCILTSLLLNRLIWTISFDS